MLRRGNRRLIYDQEPFDKFGQPYFCLWKFGFKLENVYFKTTLSVKCLIIALKFSCFFLLIYRKSEAAGRTRRVCGRGWSESGDRGARSQAETGFD